MAYANPGDVATNSLVPLGSQGLDQAAWSYGAMDALATGIVDQARSGASVIGMPASWPYGPISRTEVRSDGSLSPLLMSKLQSFVNGPAKTDNDFGEWLGADYSLASPGGYQAPPMSYQEELARRQQDLAEAKYYTSGVGTGNTSSVPSSTAIRNTATSGYGSSSPGSSNADDLAFEQQQNSMQLDYLAKSNALKLDLLRAQLALENDPNNPQLQLERDKMAQQAAIAQAQLDQELQLQRETLAQNASQFGENLDYQKDRDTKSLGLDRGKIIADYSANPGDPVARDYFLRQQGQEPTGTAVDIFSGARGGQTTFSQMMRDQAPMLAQYAQANLTNAPGAEGGGATTPPPATPPPGTPPPEPTPD